MFLLIQLVPRLSHLVKRNKRHMCVYFNSFFSILRTASCIVGRLKYEILDIQMKQNGSRMGKETFVLILLLLFVLWRHHWVNCGRWRIININMCEHEQKFSCTWCRFLFFSFSLCHWKILSWLLCSLKKKYIFYDSLLVS